jgi:hypothetical protein
MILGFSTRCLLKNHERITKEIFVVLRSIGCNAVEVKCADDQELKELILKISPGDVAGFSYVSLHAPMIINIETLELLQKAQDIFHFDLVVIHPDEIESWNIFSKFTFPIAIENMDWKSEVGKYVDSLRDIFSKIKASLALDLNHCYTNDPSMMLAKEMSEKFQDKILEINVSGFERSHEPLFQTKQLDILKAISKKDLPIIIESECETLEDVRKEFLYVKNFLEH